HQYIFYNIKPNNFEKVQEYTPINISFENEYIITSFTSQNTIQNASIVIISYSKDKKEGISFIPINSTTSISFDKNIEKIMLCIRVQGEGKIKFDQISIKERKKICIEESKSDYLVLTNFYPSEDNLYKNGFVHRRVKSYIKNGLNVDVFTFNYDERNRFSKYEFDGVNVFKGYKEELKRLLQNSSYKKILIHFINMEMYQVIKFVNKDIDIIVWFHGAEVRPWYRRHFEYNEDTVINKIIQSSNARMSFMKNLFSEKLEKVHYIFVSETFKNEVEEDLCIKLDNKYYSIIHNVIDENLFVYNEKNLEHRKKILSIRPFESRKYANDLSVLAVLELSKQEYFDELEFCFYGEGKLFEETLAPLKKFDNVKIYKQYLKQEDIPKIHKDYGIFLVPTRDDSQGVSRDESMSSGLVPITNKVSSIPEFVNKTCGMLAEGEDYIGIAKSIQYLYLNAEEFLQMSKLAAEHVREISSEKNTILREIELIKASNICKNNEAKISNVKENKKLYNHQPNISIIMASYNVEKYIDETINSIINQTIGFKNLELIVVDDASNDKTPNILSSYSKQYENITVIYNKERKKYPGKSRNKALKVAKGEYIIVLDSDDILCKDSCMTMYNLMKIYKSDYIIGKYSYYHEINNRLEPAALFETIKYTKPAINFNLLSLDNSGEVDVNSKLTLEDVMIQPGTSCNKIFKREFLILNNIEYREDQITGEDYILNHECLLKASKISYFPVEVFLYRRRNDSNNKSITQNFTFEILEDLMKQKTRTSKLYQRTKYSFDSMTNRYFLGIFYQKIIEIKDYPDDELIKILEYIRKNLYLFDLEDNKLSVKARDIFNYIKYEKYDQLFKIIRN
ncbi:glycosyltransferase, partial [Romboutsia sp.]|uniref:glycosyltransferase n=1 Tax=Romboutsia sp. TaxID=1965302 RepID=UPI003F3AB4D2